MIDNGQVFAIGAGGRMVALDITSGQRMWELNIAGISTPWVAGDWVFVVTSDAKLLCIYRQNGHVRWINQLPQFEKPKAKKGDIEYSGPVLAGNRLFLTGVERAADPARSGDRQLPVAGVDRRRASAFRRSSPIRRSTSSTTTPGCTRIGNLYRLREKVDSRAARAGEGVAASSTPSPFRRFAAPSLSP